MNNRLYNLFKSFFNMEIERLFLYKLNNFFELFIDLIPILVMQFIWNAGYSSTMIESVFDLNSMYLYTLISLGLTSIYGNSVIEKFSRKVIKGDVVFDLIKPINNYIMYFFEDISRVVKFLLIRFIPIVIITAIFFRITFNNIQIAILIPFMIMVIFGYIIMFDICYLASLFSAWIINVYTCRFMINQIFRVLSGAIIPLWMWNESVSNILYMTPFPYVIAIPTSFLIGGIDMKYFNVIAIQLIWIIILKFIIVVIYKKYRIKLNIQGG